MNEGSYAITETLSQDENATLYRALRCSDRKPVVLKVLGRDTHQLRELERLRNELEIAGALDQPTVLRPLMLVMYEGTPALVSEDFAGVPLERLLGRSMDIGRFLALASAIAAGLEQIHRAGLVHKDVTPRNIFVSPSTQEIRLYGFGLASRIPRQPSVSQPPELIEGTLPFMSPEQTGSMNRAVDSRSDLYSLGVLLYQTVTGALPIDGPDVLSVCRKHVMEMPIRPLERAPGAVMMELDRVIMKMLAKHPQQRYQNAAEARAALQSALPRR